MRQVSLFAIFLLCCGCTAWASDLPDSLGTLTLLSEPTGADVYVDTLYIGKTPLVALALREGSHRIKLFYPSVFAWNSVTREDTVRIDAQGQTEKIIELGSVLAIRSVPSGGTVTLQGTELGTTPLFFRSPTRLSGELLIQKEGFEPHRLQLGRQEDQLLAVTLVQKAGVTPLNDFSITDQKAISARTWPLYASGSAMIVSGVLSAYLKDQANREFDRYLQSRDPASLSTTRRLDRAAAISLVVSQVSFAVLSYLLLSD
ncbi:MAG: PEGA domain-containing protein [Ignavibacteria bacterium]|nr:PEGA domain-containing protein [Ignavibacteria bacterium]